MTLLSKATEADIPQLSQLLNLLFSVSTALGERVATLEDMVVAPAARGSGLDPVCAGQRGKADYVAHGP